MHLEVVSVCALGLALGGSRIVAAQVVSSQNNTFNSTYTISESVADGYGVNSTVLHNTNVALDFERSNQAHGPVASVGFYRVPTNASNAAPGSLLKVEIDANTSSYTIPPNTALSRIMFQTRDLNGTAAPASAYVLWPYHPREMGDGYPVVGFAHGACGAFGDCAPSHLRTLWYHFEVPFELALQGYVVVAPDYRGLGVNTDASGQPIYNNFLANNAEADDLFYAVQAAQTAFPELSRRFVTMGHSQGGGAAWAAAHRQAAEPVEGYLGTIPISPVTRLLDQSPTGHRMNESSNTAALVGHGLSTVFPDFNLSSVLTPAGVERLEFLRKIQGCNAVVAEAFPASDISSLVYPNWASDPHMQAYQSLTENGNRPISGPMLVLQGTGDPAVPEPLTTSVVNHTCATYPEAAVLHYVRFEGVGHTPTCYASRRIWLDWIAQRFTADADAVVVGCTWEEIKSARPYQHYQFETNWFLEYSTQSYELD